MPMALLPKYLVCWCVKVNEQLRRQLRGENYELVRYVTARRWTFVIGKDGKVIHIDKQAKARQDSKNTLAFLKEIAGEEE